MAIHHLIPPNNGDVDVERREQRRTAVNHQHHQDNERNQTKWTNIIAKVILLLIGLLIIGNLSLNLLAHLDSYYDGRMNHRNSMISNNKSSFHHRDDHSHSHHENHHQHKSPSLSSSSSSSQTNKNKKKTNHHYYFYDPNGRLITVEAYPTEMLLKDPRLIMESSSTYNEDSKHRTVLTSTYNNAIPKWMNIFSIPYDVATITINKTNDEASKNEEESSSSAIKYKDEGKFPYMLGKKVLLVLNDTKNQVCYQEVKDYPALSMMIYNEMFNKPFLYSDYCYHRHCKQIANKTIVDKYFELGCRGRDGTNFCQMEYKIERVF